MIAAGLILAAAWGAPGADPVPAEVAAEADVPPVRKACVAVFDFDGGAEAMDLADRVRLRLGRHAECAVVDARTTRQISSPPDLNSDAARVQVVMARLAADVAMFGRVYRTGNSLGAVVRCVDRTNPASQKEWVKTLTAGGQQAAGELAKQIVETLREKAEWSPPEYGDEEEPKLAELGRALNVNGDFEAGAAGWEGPDNVGTFLVEGPTGRGTVLKIRTDLERGPWLEYRRKLMFAQADPNDPPQVGRDTSLKSVAATEGVHYAGDWIAARPGRRYWLTADVKCRKTGGAFPRIFVKGFADMGATATGLPERSLVERQLTPKDFAALPAERRKELIAEDAAAYPERYRREVYRWYLACRNESGDWMHAAAPFPPRGSTGSPPGGGLPDNVQYLQVQVYAYWPAGEYEFDNVLLYADPRQGKN